MAALQHKLHEGDCVQVIEERDLKADCVFADPPDNIGLQYDNYDDKLGDAEYIAWFDTVLHSLVEVAPTIWLSFNARWTVDFGYLIKCFLHDNLEWECKPCVQVFTFGQHRESDLGNNHRPLWRLKHKDAPIYPDQIRVPSWRQRNGDKRASPKGRVPGDVFDMQYPKKGTRVSVTETERGYEVSLNGAPAVVLGDGNVSYTEVPTDPLPGDVFDFPRVTGNSKQRCDWHPTQLHEELVERCIKLSTLEGQTVFDPFGGTGTTMRVCRRINRQSILSELDPIYCEHIAEANGLARHDDWWGRNDA